MKTVNRAVGMTEQYFINKWGDKPGALYRGLLDADTFKPTLEKVGVRKAFELVADLTQYYIHTEQFERCANLRSVRIGLENGLAEL